MSLLPKIADSSGSRLPPWDTNFPPGRGLNPRRTPAADSRVNAWLAGRVSPILPRGSLPMRNSRSAALLARITSLTSTRTFLDYDLFLSRYRDPVIFAPLLDRVYFVLDHQYRSGIHEYALPVDVRYHTMFLRLVAALAAQIPLRSWRSHGYTMALARPTLLSGLITRSKRRTRGP